MTKINLGPGILSANDNAEIGQPSLSALKWLFSFCGESNSGGTAPNSNLTVSEALARPELQMLNVSTDVFEALHIGTNNNLAHQQLTAATHGFENHLAALVKSDPAVEGYLVQTGQGGSRAAEWDNVGTDPHIATRDGRIATARGLVTFDREVIWYSQGINDAIAGLPAANWETTTRLVLGLLNTLMPTANVIMTKLPIDSAIGQAQKDLQVAYNGVIDTLVGDLAYVRSVESQSGFQMQDGNHWGYTGLKDVASLLWQETFRA